MNDSSDDNARPNDSRRRFPKRWGVAIALLLVLGTSLFTIRIVMERQMPTHRLGLIDGKLAPCPDSPNCVTTAPGAGDKSMEPLQFTGTVDEALDRLETIARTFPRTRVVSRTDRYLHIEFRSWLFRFVDDVEFHIPPDQEADRPLRIDFRSASRTGYSDLGVNRKRMTQFASRFSASTD